MIPVSVIVITKNEEANLPRCLRALDGFAEVIVVDSASTDATRAIAIAHGARVVDFAWDGAYPKKKQWAVDHAGARYDWVFLVDADEEVTADLRAAMVALFAGGTPPCAGYFVRGRYVADGVALRFGLHNAKLCLYDRRAFAFPVIDDLDLPMGEVEGHYQPQAVSPPARIGVLRPPLYHHAGGDWRARHERYAVWEAGMNRRNAWPADPVWWRERLKRVFRRLPARGAVAFIHAYVLKGGIANGPAGFRQARERYIYYRLIAQAGRQAGRGLPP